MNSRFYASSSLVMSLLVKTLLVTSVCQAAADSAAILEHTRQIVAAQLARAANYSCVQTIDRKYYVPDLALPSGCGLAPPTRHKVLLLRDRLRLDVAVSEGNEIYSWHAAAKFSSSDVSEVVRTGPISSGNFTGFLRNIFLEDGAAFAYSGETTENSLKLYNFEYAVPLPYSTYHVQAKASKAAIPYHGSFSLDATNYQLRKLQIVGDRLPADSPICLVTTTITYQLVPVSGQLSLIPATFALEVDTDTHVYTVSSSQYSQCREFRGESTVHFEFSDSPSEAAEEARREEWLPAGLSLHVKLGAEIDDSTAYVGDRVEGSLQRPIKVPGTEMIVPKGALVEGVITKLEDHYQPMSFQLFSVRWNRVRFGNRSYLLRAMPKTGLGDRDVLVKAYGAPLPPSVAEDYHEGLFAMLGSHLHLEHFSGLWITGSPASNEAAASLQ